MDLNGEIKLDRQLTDAEKNAIRLEGSHAEQGDKCPYIEGTEPYTLWMEGHLTRDPHFYPTDELRHGR